MSKIINIIKTVLSETDFFLLFMCIATSGYGILMVYSATLAEKDPSMVISRDARTMIIAVAAGIVGAIIISFIDYNFISKMFPVIGAVCVLLLVLTLFIGVGPAERPDAKTWLKLGSTGLFFQPSELMKVGFIITLSMHIELIGDRLTQFRHILFLGIHAAIPIGLVVLSGDMGSALVFLLIFIAIAFCAGVQLRYFAVGAAAVCAAAPAVWYFLFDSTQKERFLGLIYPELYSDIMYQQEQGLKALKNGGLTGCGLFNGILTQQPNAIPEAENDMIFTAIGEELGFVGCVLAITMLTAISLKMIHIGRRSKFGATSLMCYGTAAMIIGQMIINIGMCLKILPVIGITLPFFSAGGSSNLCIYIAVGLAMSIYRFDKDREVTNVRIAPIFSLQN